MVSRNFFCWIPIALLMAGCTLVPGSRLSYDADGFDDKSLALPDIVEVMPITTGILQSANNPGREMDKPLPLVSGTASYRYEVGVGDVLQVTVWDHPELTIPAGSKRSAAESGNVVHSDGTIFYPYVGKVEVAGKNVVEIRQLVTERLAAYIQDPQVDVRVAAFNSQHVYVTGAVEQPGMVPVSNIPLHLIDAINRAGGLNQLANWRDVTLIRDDKRYQLSLKAIYQQGKLQQNLLLRDGDVINVGRNDDNKVFVLGEVGQPQILPMGRNGLSLAEALAGAGGIDQMQADASGVFVMREANTDAKPRIDIYQLHAQDAAALVLADQFRLQPRDIVYVTAAPLALWNRVIKQLLPTVQGIYYGALAADRVKVLDE